MPRWRFATLSPPHVTFHPHPSPPPSRGGDKVADLVNSFDSAALHQGYVAVQGLPNKHIARQLGIGHLTVEIHKSKIMQKTGAINLLDLARIVHEVSSST